MSILSATKSVLKSGRAPKTIVGLTVLGAIVYGMTHLNKDNSATENAR